jgi:hypothetical protein
VVAPPTAGEEVGLAAAPPKTNDFFGAPPLPPSSCVEAAAGWEAPLPNTNGLLTAGTGAAPSPLAAAFWLAKANRLFAAPGAAPGSGAALPPNTNADFALATGTACSTAAVPVEVTSGVSLSSISSTTSWVSSTTSPWSLPSSSLASSSSSSSTTTTSSSSSSSSSPSPSPLLSPELGGVTSLLVAGASRGFFAPNRDPAPDAPPAGV